MSTNQHTPLSDDVSSTPAIPVSQTAMTPYQDAGWNNVAAWAEPDQVSTLNLAPYLHALRRHWVVATAVGLLCAAILAPLVAFWAWPAQYLAVAYLQVLPTEERVVSLTGGRDFLNQQAYITFKNTQAQTVVNPLVLIATLRNADVMKLKLDEREDDVATWLQEHLKVTFPGESQIMEVGLKTDDPKEAATIVNAVVTAYMEEVVGRKQQGRLNRLRKLKDIRDKHESTIRSGRNNQTRLAEQLGISKDDAISAKQQSAVREFGTYRMEYIRAQLARRNAEEELKAQKELLEAVDALEISDAEVDMHGKRTDPQFRRLLEEMARQRYTTSQAQAAIRTDANSSYAQRSSGQMGALLAEVAELREALREELRASKRAQYEETIREKTVERNCWAAQEEQLKDDVEKQNRELEQIGGSSVELEMTQDDINNRTQVLRGVEAQIAEVEAELEADPQIRLLSQAAPPLTQDGLPLRIAITVLATLSAYCLPVGLIVWWDARAKRINTTADVSKGLGLTVLGSVPMIPARVIPRLDSPSTRYRNWSLRLSESVDGVAARLLRKADIEQARIILVSSAVAGEGKTTLATQLAMSLARSGRNTVLVDFDLRRPAFDEAFGLPLEPGVSDVLRGESDLNPPVHETGTENLAVVTAGRWDRHALAALANGAAGAMFEKLRTEYEFVIVDASPILPVADTRFVSQYVDTVILSVFRDLSQAPKVEAAREILEAFGCRSVEAVVTGSTEMADAKDLGYGLRLLESA